MHQRKAEMARQADAFIALPGPYFFVIKIQINIIYAHQSFSMYNYLFPFFYITIIFQRSWNIFFFFNKKIKIYLKVSSSQDNRMHNGQPSVILLNSIKIKIACRWLWHLGRTFGSDHLGSIGNPWKTGNSSILSHYLTILSLLLD